MENRVNGLEQLEELEEDTLSLCNLAMQESGSSANQSPRANPFSAQELFEFSNELSSPEFYHSAPDIIFCGKIIQEEEELNEDHENADNRVPASTFQAPSLSTRSSLVGGLTNLQAGSASGGFEMQ